jgi:hypothetical protein
MRQPGLPPGEEILKKEKHGPYSRAIDPHSHEREI